MNVRELRLLLASIPDDTEVVGVIDEDYREPPQYYFARRVKQLPLYKYHTGDIGSLEAKYATKFEAIIIE